MKDKKLWKQLAREAIVLAIAALLSAFLWPVSCLLGQNSDWILKLSEQLSWVFILSTALTFYHFIKAANEDTRREDEIRADQTTVKTLMEKAANEKAQRIISEAAKSTSLPLKEGSFRDLDMALCEYKNALKTLFIVKMLYPWEKTLSRNEENGIMEIYGYLGRIGDGGCEVYLYDDFKIAPSSTHGFGFTYVDGEFIDELIDDAAVKIAEEIVAIDRSIKAKARPSSSPSPSNTLDIPNDQPLEVTRVVLFAPLPKPTETDSSFTTTTL